MGSDAKAVLAYGIDLGDRYNVEKLLGIENFDEEEYIDTVAGLQHIPWPERVAERNKYPVKFERHGVLFDDPSFALVIPSTVRSADWERARPLGHIPALTVHDVTAFDRWCAERGIKGEGSWLLMAGWG